MLRHVEIFHARQRARFMRPDAARYIRPDVDRWLAPPHPDERKYSPSQPRDWRGRWTDGGGGAGGDSASQTGRINFGDLPSFSDLFGLFQITPGDGAFGGIQLASDGKPLLDSFGEPYYAPGGHHELPQAVFGKWDLPPETRRIFDQATTGPLKEGRVNVDGEMRGHYWDRPHREYNDAINELSEEFFQDRKIEVSKMTPEQARDLLKEIRETEEPRIRNYNRVMRMIRRIFRSGRE